MTPQHSTPYWRLSGFYLFYFASLGALLPYWSPYLRSLGFAESQIGELVAIIMATKIVAPNVWGWIADHVGMRMAVVRLASLLAIVCFAGVFVASDYWWLALVMTAFSFFWNASLPQFEATTMNHLGEQPHRYSSIRLWGSIGFIATVAGLGALFDAVEISWLPWVLVALFVGIWVNSLAVPERAAGHLPVDHEPLRRVLVRKEVAALLAVCFLLQASHGPYYTFYTIYLEDYGYRRSLIGQLWALGVAAEIGLFVVMHRLLPRLGSRRLLLIALSITTLRWLLIGAFPERLGVLVFAQTLHAASFGVVHAVAIHLIHRFFTGPHQGKGQALYSSTSFGAGGAVGSLYAGYLWSDAGPVAAFAAAALFSAGAFALTWRGLDTRD
ncbi:MAG: MFS transporter [Gammaproteobacteria bacterium]|nr:MFS transporter [Gammaproteobacteria bacterium]NIR96935.1 MFS transporter [Gammaproteobacteria bacterium]NIT62637.1 MFS transporter [Gammaproteobacteria bacterium]NIV19597.1 MFS transporter [Gammaproteobacteria bacterium]NIX10817.1 MFS transporter [Gammaproteobacteria bacterium]